VTEIFAEWDDHPPTAECLQIIASALGWSADKTKNPRKAPAQNPIADPRLRDPRAIAVAGVAAGARSMGLPAAHAGKIPEYMKRILHPKQDG